MKSQVNSGEIKVRKDFAETMQNVGSRRLTSKSAKLIYIVQYSKFNHNKQGKRSEESKKRLNRYSGQVDSRTSE